MLINSRGEADETEAAAAVARASSLQPAPIEAMPNEASGLLALLHRRSFSIDRARILDPDIDRVMAEPRDLLSLRPHDTRLRAGCACIHAVHTTAAIIPLTTCACCVRSCAVEDGPLYEDKLRALCTALAASGKVLRLKAVVRLMPPGAHASRHTTDRSEPGEHAAGGRAMDERWGGGDEVSVAGVEARDGSPVAGAGECMWAVIDGVEERWALRKLSGDASGPYLGAADETLAMQPPVDTLSPSPSTHVPSVLKSALSDGEQPSKLYALGRNLPIGSLRRDFQATCPLE